MAYCYENWKRMYTKRQFRFLVDWVLWKVLDDDVDVVNEGKDERWREKPSNIVYWFILKKKL